MKVTIVDLHAEDFKMSMTENMLTITLMVSTTTGTNQMHDTPLHKYKC